MLAIAVAAAGGAASSAQAAVHTVTARDDAWWPSTLTIAVGDTVRWVNDDGVHNLVLDGYGELADFGDPASPEWNPPPERAFPADATLGFVCQAHGGMTGTIKVGAGGTQPPPGGGGGDGSGGDGGGTGGGSGGGTGGTGDTGGGSTGGGSAGGGSPQPSGAADAVRPVVRAVRAKAKGRAVRLGFRLSEAATVIVKVKRRGARKPVKTVRVRLRAGVRAVKVKRLRPGRYTFEISARDAAGNRSGLKRASLSLG